MSSLMAKGIVYEVYPQAQAQMIGWRQNDFTDNSVVPKHHAIVW
jgi:hypothetical protein